MEVPQKLKVDLSYDPAIPLLGIYLKKTKTLMMLIASLFTIAQIWKQPKHSSVDKWIKKMWYACVCVYV